jgi:hypothetical protein
MFCQNAVAAIAGGAKKTSLANEIVRNIFSVYFYLNKNFDFYWTANSLIGVETRITKAFVCAKGLIPTDKKWEQ